MLAFASRLLVLLSIVFAGALLGSPAQADALVLSLQPTAEECGVVVVFDGSDIAWQATCKSELGTRVGSAIEGPDQLIQVQVAGPALDLDEEAVLDLLDKASELRGQNPGYADALIDALLAGA